VHVTVAYGGAEVKLKAFLASTLDEGEWLASHSNGFSVGERRQTPGA